MLWGTKRSGTPRRRPRSARSVLVSAALEPLRQADAGVKALRLEGGRLVACPRLQTRSSRGHGVVGTVLQGTASDGKPVEVAICGAEPSPEDPSMVWYRIEAWNAVAQEWENPCVALDRVPDPRALAVGGVWDASGAHKDIPGKFTFACENGAITKCIQLGLQALGEPRRAVAGRAPPGLHAHGARGLLRQWPQPHAPGHHHRHVRSARHVRADHRDLRGLGSGEGARSRRRGGPMGPRAWHAPGMAARWRPSSRSAPTASARARASSWAKGDRCTVQRVDVNPGAALLRNQSYGGLRRRAAPRPGSRERMPGWQRSLGVGSGAGCSAQELADAQVELAVERAARKLWKSCVERPRRSCRRRRVSL